MIRNVVVAVLIAGFSVVATGQTKSGFVTTLGNDTLGVEEYSMTGNEVTGSSVFRSPQTMVQTFRASFTPDGRLERFHVESQPYGKPVNSVRDYVYSDDSVQVTMKQGESVRQMSVPATGRPFPLFVNLFTGWSIAIQRAMNQGKSEFGILAGRRVLHYDVKKEAGQIVDLVNPGQDFGPLHAVVGSNGEFSRFDMRETTDKFIVDRVQGIDVKAMGARFAEQENKGKGMGALSPRDSVKVTVNGGHVTVDYGRPSVRGRKIFGNVVPWGQVWRTGANAATQLSCDKRVMIGSAMLEPGTYSLFTIPTESGWTLIVNSQHGQWGTVYDQSKDIVRVPMTVKQIPGLVEQFVIEIIPRGMNATLLMRWEHTEASVDFMVH